MKDESLKSKKIIFCFPYRGGPGGVSMLFLRLADYLKKNGCDTAIIDYPDGEMSNNKHPSLQLIEYCNDKKLFLPEKSIIVFQSMTPWSIFRNIVIPRNTKLLFITTLPNNLFPLMPGKLRNLMSNGRIFAKFFWKSILILEYYKIKRFIKIADERNGIVFLDKNIVSNVEKSLNLKIKKPKLLPLPGEQISENLFLKKSSNISAIKIGWVGRISDFKIHILNNVIKDAFHYSNKNKQKIIFNILGDGDCKELLQRYSSDYFCMEYVNYIKPNQLSNHLINVDLIFAMGTAALDAARIGVPTVRLDYSFSKVTKNYLYKMLYEVNNLSLGENIHGDSYQNGKHTFDDLIELIKKSRTSLSTKCYDYFVRNHSIENNSIIFNDYLTNSNLQWEDLIDEKVLESSLYRLWKNINYIFQKVNSLNR